MVQDAEKYKSALSLIIALVLFSVLHHALFIKGRLHVEAVRLQAVLGGNSSALSLIIALVLFGVLHHALDLLLAEATLVIGDGDLVQLASGLVHSRHVQDTVCIDVEGDLDLRHSTGCWGNALKFKLAKKVVVLGHSTLSFIDLDEHTRLVVSVGGEGLSLLGRDGSVPLDEGSHHTTSSLNTHRQGSNIQQEQVLHSLGLVTRQDSSLHSGTIGNGLIRVDGLVKLLAIEEVLQKFLDLGDTGRPSNQYNLLDLALVKLGISEGLLNWVKSSTEEISTQFFETSPSDRGIEIGSIIKGINFNRSLSRRRQGPLSTFTGSPQTTKRPLLGGQILLELALELLSEVVDQTVVKIFTTKMGISSSGLYLKDAILNSENGIFEVKS